MVGDILQPTHLLFILVVALLVLGPKRLPEVGRTLGTGLRDFKSAINGESHEDREPQAYVETEPDPVPAHDQLEPTGFDLSADESDTPQDSTAPDVSVVVKDPADTTATPATALHEHALDPDAASDDLHAPTATEDLQAPAATEVLQTTGDLHAPAATDETETVGADADTVRTPVAAGSSNGFASALASSRQPAVNDGEPAADDE